MKPLLLFCLFLLPFNMPLAKNAPWTLEKDENGVKVYLRAVEGSGIQEFKAVMRIQSSMGSLLGLLSDTAACTDWVHQCIEPELVHFGGFHERVTYQVSDMPFPASNRALLFHAKTEHQLKDNIITVTFTNAPQYCDERQTKVCQRINQQDYIKVSTFQGYYRLKPISSSETQVTWQQHIEPGGALPDWLVNSLLIDIPYYSLLKMSQLVQQKKYQAIRLHYSQDGLAVGFQQ